MTNTDNQLTIIDNNELENVLGGESNPSGQPPSTWAGCTASAFGNWLQGQSGGGAISDWGRCVQTGQPIPQGGTPSPQQPTS